MTELARSPLSGEPVRLRLATGRVVLWAMTFAVMVATHSAAARSQTDSATGSFGLARVREGISCLNLRQGPDSQSAVEECMSPGSVVEILEAGAERHRVRLKDGRQGWMAAGYLERIPETSLRAVGEGDVDRAAVAPSATEPSPEESIDKSPERDESPEREQLESQAADLETNVARLQQIVDEYRVAEQELLERRAATMESLRVLRERDEAATAEEMELIRRVDSAEASVRDLRSVVDEGRRSERALEADLGEISSALTELRATLDELRELEASVDGELQTSLSTISEMESALERSQANRERLRFELRTSLEAVDRLQERVAATVALEGELELQIGELETGFVALDGARDAMERQLEEEGAREERLRRDLEGATEVMGRIEDRVTRTVADAGGVDFEVRKLTSQLVDLDGQAVTLEADLTTLVESLEAAKRSERGLRADLESSQDSVRDLEGRRSAARARLEGEVKAPEAGRDEIGTAAAGAAPVSVAASIPSDPGEAVREVVRAWAAAWESGRVEEYLAFYADVFQPNGGSTREAWEADRRAKVGRASDVRVRLDDLSVVAGEERATARFLQAYRSETYADEVIKRLELARRNDRWQITGESVELVVSKGR